MTKKLLVIGLDGATFDLLDPLIDQGLLPHLERLRAQGVWARLASTTPPVSVPAWPSFATGRNPGKTGMYDFCVRKPQSYKLTPSPPLRVRPFWETFSEHGLRVGVVNVPGSYPPRPVHGFIVTGMMTPSTDVDFTFPAELRGKLHELTGGYKLDCEHGWWEYADDAAFVAEITELIDQRFQVFNYLMDREPWDFLCLVITETDRFHHRMWKHIDPTHPQAEARFADCFAQLYARLDAGLGQILSRVDSQTNVVIMSDHGFGPCRYAFSPLVWLMREGYLKLRTRWKDHTFLRHLSTESVARWLDRLHVKKLINMLLPVRAKQAAIDMLGHEDQRHDLERLIDWQRTRAYALPLSNGYGNIFLNVKGRDPQGVVEPGTEAEKLRDEIRAKLEALANPLAPTKLVVETHVSSDLYSADTNLQPPDLIYSLDDYSYMIENGKVHGEVFEPHDLAHHSGSHRPDGILIASGPAFKKRYEVRAIALLDLAPTFHHLTGVPVAKDFDGRVLTEILSEPTQSVSVNEGAADATATEFVYSDEEVAQIETRLRQLGYVD